jgi:integrase
MSIYPDKKNGQLTGRWRVEVQLNGLRRRGRFNTHPEAKEAEQKWTDELASGETASATLRADQTVPKMLSHLLAKAAPLLWDKDKHGILSVKKVRWFIENCGDPQLARIPADYIDKAVLKLRRAGKAEATINRYLSALHAVLGWGAKPARRYVPLMPEFSWQDEDEGRIRWLSPVEEQRLIATFHAFAEQARADGDEDRAAVLEEIADLCIVAIDTGCRRGELLAAQRDQLNGKWLRLWKTKNRKARSVPLSNRAQAILAQRLPFTVREHQLRYAWEKAKATMGLGQDEDFVFHCLRHTRATRLVEMGVNLRVIQQFMGHRTIQTTIRYAHVSDEMLVQTVEAIDRWNHVNLTQISGGDQLTQPGSVLGQPVARADLESVQ